MGLRVVHVKRRAGTITKPVVDLTKDRSGRVKEPTASNAVVSGKALEAKPVKQRQPQQPRRLHIKAAPDGPPIAADLPEEHRNKVEPARKPLTDKQEEILGQIIESAGEGNPKTIGLRLVLAASQHKDAGAWPIGLLAKAFHLSGRQLEGDAVYKVASGCRVARFRDMAASALTLLNQEPEVSER
jgi:hypothetical protein